MVTILSKLGKLKNIRLKIKFGLRLSTLITYVLISILPLLFFYFMISQFVEQQLVEVKQKQIRYLATSTATNISESNYLTDETKKFEFKFDLDKRSKDNLARIMVVDTLSTVVYDSNDMNIGRTYVLNDLSSALDGQTTVNYIDTMDGKAIYAASPIMLQEDSKKIIGAVLFSVPRGEDIPDVMRAMTAQISILLIITMSVVIVISFLSSQIIIEPLKNVLKTLQKMSEGHLSERIEINSHNEIGEISEAFNKMADRLESVDVSRQEFVSNVSHELKTPLSAMKVLSESILFMENLPEEMYKEFLMDINGEIDRMTDIINDLLTLVKIDQREHPLSFKTKNINKMVADIVKRLQPLASNKSIAIIQDNVKEVSAEVDPTKLTLAISNLIENAIKYTPSKGKVKMTINADHQNVFISVADSGIGIAEDELNKIFDRFYRVDKTRDRETGGSGLGLSITQRAVLLHNGSIRVNSKENEGSTFIIRIPIHQL